MRGIWLSGLLQVNRAKSRCRGLQLCANLTGPSSRSLSVKRIRVLFLCATICATNGVQSPMAEALLNRLGSEHFEVTSAGIERGEMHPLTVDVMRAIGIDMEGRVSK